MKKMIFKIAAGVLLVSGLAFNIALSTNDNGFSLSLQDLAKPAIAQAETPGQQCPHTCTDCWCTYDRIYSMPNRKK